MFAVHFSWNSHHRRYLKTGSFKPFNNSWFYIEDNMKVCDIFREHSLIQKFWKCSTMFKWCWSSEKGGISKYTSCDDKIVALTDFNMYILLQLFFSSSHFFTKFGGCKFDKLGSYLYHLLTFLTFYLVIPREEDRWSRFIIH